MMDAVERGMGGPRTFRFETMPALWPAYARLLLGRKPRLIADDGHVPRLEAVLKEARISRAHLARYNACCGVRDTEALPIAYPHVLAMPLHMRLLACSAFPVRIAGFVHTRSRISQRRPVRPDERGELRTWVEGHRETPKGQEFDLLTELAIDGEIAWSEVCTYLARQRPKRVPRGSRAPTAPPIEHAQPASASACRIRADSGLGRRYALAAGDFNPIHLTNLSARLFGFEQAIAHGMWSLARCAAALSPDALRQPCELDVYFKRPVRLPSDLVLYTWKIATGEAFALRNSDNERAHLSGGLTVGATL